MSKASKIAEALSERVSKVDITRGFETDIGTRVYRGRRALDENAIPCTVILEGDDEPKSQQGAAVKLDQEYVLEGHAKCDPNNPNDVGLAIVSDLKRAVFTGEDLPGCFSDIKYIGRTIMPREDGQAIVAAAIRIKVSFAEDLGNP